MKRSALRRKTPLRRRALARRRERVSRYARRERDFAYMGFVKTLVCSVVEEWPQKHVMPTPCNGAIEADHNNSGVMSRKDADRNTFPMCNGHHRERTDHTGTFKHVRRDEERAWRTRAISRTQALWEERDGSPLL